MNTDRHNKTQKDTKFMVPNQLAWWKLKDLVLRRILWIEKADPVVGSACRPTRTHRTEPPGRSSHAHSGGAASVGSRGKPARLRRCIADKNGALSYTQYTFYDHPLRYLLQETLRIATNLSFKAQGCTRECSLRFRPSSALPNFRGLPACPAQPWRRWEESPYCTPVVLLCASSWLNKNPTTKETTL
jgi:hypothetical protein